MKLIIGRALILAGVGGMAWSGCVWIRADQEQAVRARALPVVERHTTPDRGSTLGLLEVTRLGLSTVVIEGDDAANLLVAAGHLPDTPLPWQDGNSVIAGHRDTDFSPLKDIQKGDVVRIRTANKALDYIVRETRIVDPTEVSVLQPTTRPTLTLITCYPFRYIGPAPKRFVVRAERSAPSG